MAEAERRRSSRDQDSLERDWHERHPNPSGLPPLHPDLQEAAARAMGADYAESAE